MKNNISYTEARDLLISLTLITAKENVDLADAAGRILAEPLAADEDVPPFDRSPYDGYALRSDDTQTASKEHPVTFSVIDEIPAGSLSSRIVTEGTAVKIMTGAPIPDGADAVIMYEKTEFTDKSVTVFSPLKSGENVIYAGEDVKKGQLLAPKGTVIDAGLSGTLASQGVQHPPVYRKPLAGIISTGSELVEISEPVPAGKIRNSNRYTLSAALKKDGYETAYLGTAGDDITEIAGLIKKGIEECDMVIITGGVSAGDYDLTPDAMEHAGCELLIKGVDLKPGMACCYGIKDGKLVLGLSGNPSSSLTNYYAVVRPAVRKMTGISPFMPEEISVTIARDLDKKGKTTRIIKGRMKIENGKVMMYLPEGQGNVMISSSIGCNIMAVVPPFTGPLKAGTELKGFLV